MKQKVLKFFTFILILVIVDDVKSSCKKCEARRNERNVSFRMPTVNFEVFVPRTVRISVPDENGMQLFAFHGKVNSQIRENETGTLSEQVLRPTDGKWIVQFNDVDIRVGDVIYYWIYIQMNNIGKSGRRIAHIVQDVVSPFVPTESYNIAASNLQAHGKQGPLTEYTAQNEASTSRITESYTYRPPTTPLPLFACPPIPALSTPMPPSVNCECTKNELNAMEAQLLQTTNNINFLTNQVDHLQKKIDSLTELVEDMFQGMNIGTELLLTGNPPPGTNPLEGVRTLITEKLELFDLSENINQAHVTEDGIVFDMKSPIDKKRILSRASHRLKNSKYQIIDYQPFLSSLIDTRSGVI